MATVKVVLRNKPNKQGLLPLVMRITKDRKSSEIHLGYNLKPSDWDEENNRVKKSYPNSARLNNFILKKLSDAASNALDLETSSSQVSSAAVKLKTRPNAASTFFAQAKLYLDRLEKDGKFNQHSANKPRLKHFKEYIGHDIAFQDISVGLLERFKADLKTTYGMAERSAVNHLVFVRSVFSQAIKEKACDKKYYPFGKEGFKIKFPDTNKVGLNQDEVKRIETIELKDPLDDHARDVWLLSYYFAGMRISDVLRLKWSDFQDGRLVYIMGKNNKLDSLKIPEKAAVILEKQKPFKSANNDLVFRDLDRVSDWKNTYKVQRLIASRNNLIGQHLKLIKEAAEIKKPLSMHISRHTFGNISSDKISIKTLQKLYRHSSPVTTAGYQSNFIHREADEALNAVLGL